MMRCRNSAGYGRWLFGIVDTPFRPNHGVSTKPGQLQIIFPQGSPADAVFYIEKGKVKLTVLSTRGKEAVVAILGNGDFFGEGSLAGQPLRMATATAMTECSILRVQKETMVRMLHNEPALSELFMAYL